MSQNNESFKIFLGVVILFAFHIAAIVAYCLIALLLNTGLYDSSVAIFAFLIFGIGISQIIYVIPIVIILRSRREFALMKGVIIGAVITALLNGGCWLLLTLPST